MPVAGGHLDQDSPLFITGATREEVGIVPEKELNKVLPGLHNARQAECSLGHWCIRRLNPVGL